VICTRCDTVAVVLKTCRWRDRNGAAFTLCDSCWLPISGAVWVVPGRVPCFGTCLRCGGWFSVRELADRRPGGRYDSSQGTCTVCAEQRLD
jgi:hypothetical protein